MDKLKPLDEINLPDRRSKINIKDHYKVIESINLLDNVPENIRGQFEVSKNLLLYSWHVYRFRTVAELHAFTVLEYALREKSGYKNKEKSFRQLIEDSVKKGQIKDSGFQIYRQTEKNREKFIDDMKIMGVDVQDYKHQEKNRYVKILSESIPKIRNHYAHGSNTIHPGGYDTLQICADFINQLFP